MANSRSVGLDLGVPRHLVPSQDASSQKAHATPMTVSTTFGGTPSPALKSSVGRIALFMMSDHTGATVRCTRSRLWCSTMSQKDKYLTPTHSSTSFQPTSRRHSAKASIWPLLLAQERVQTRNAESNICLSQRSLRLLSECSRGPQASSAGTRHLAKKLSLSLSLTRHQTQWKKKANVGYSMM